MAVGRIALSAGLALALVGCGGGGSGSPPPVGGGPTPVPAPAPAPAPTPPPSGALQQQLNFARDVLNEWYLFPDLLDGTVTTAGFSDVQSYLDARVAPARARDIDRGFTFATSIQAENDLINSGSSAGFGIRLDYDTVNDRVTVAEAFETANGFAAGMDRGTELLAIGQPGGALTNVRTLMQSGGPQAVVDALGPGDPGVQRVLRFVDTANVERTVTVTKSEFALDPVSDRYGALILNDGGRQVGYINLRTFIIANASDQLRSAFQQFRAQGVSELIIDFRYNGGGLVSVADTLGDLLGAGRTGQVWSDTVLRASKSSENETRLFQSEPNAITPTKIAFIGRGATASASELVINSMIPYLGAGNIALIGENTFGKPVGQFGFDLAQFDLRIRAVAFQTNNADGNGEYYSGLARVVPTTCRADDDLSAPLGSPSEESIAVALDFLAGRACSPITGGGIVAQSVRGRTLLQPRRPNAVQYHMPGVF